MSEKKSETVLYDALDEMVRGYEADCKCRDVAPDDVMNNHTWIAIAYAKARAALKAARGEVLEEKYCGARS